MDFTLAAEDAAFLDEFRGYLDGLHAEGHYAEPELVRPDHHVRPDQLERRSAFIRRLGKDGWLGLTWPTEYGGQGRSSLQHWLAMDELAYRQLPSMLLGVSIVAHTLMHVGSEQQKHDFLPGILAGDLEFCLGYTEPGSGTDLASLQTRAVRDGAEYVINGQKIYTTGAQYATHVWLAARTGAPDSRHKGITVFMVPIDTPGITIRPLITAADYRTNEVFYDDVRVPVANRVGEENEGWSVLRLALRFERTPQANRAVSELGEVLDWATAPDHRGEVPADDPVVRQELAALAVDAEIVRLFAFRIADLVARGEPVTAEPSESKVYSTELYQRLASRALALMGPAGQLGVGEPGAPGEGKLELAFRESPVFQFAAGTNEVQRDIIAQQGLGLPRSSRK